MPAVLTPESPMNAAQPLVSVVLPAYNVREHVAEAIRSVHAQAFASLEIIIVDDGSTDGTADLVEREFPEVRLFRKANGGAATARNLGMRESRATYVAFLDADDVWLPGKLAAQISYMESNPQVRLAQSQKREGFVQNRIGRRIDGSDAGA